MKDKQQLNRTPLFCLYDNVDDDALHMHSHRSAFKLLQQQQPLLHGLYAVCCLFNMWSLSPSPRPCTMTFQVFSHIFWLNRVTASACAEYIESKNLVDCCFFSSDCKRMSLPQWRLNWATTICISNFLLCKLSYSMNPNCERLIEKLSINIFILLSVIDVSNL